MHRSYEGYLDDLLLWSISISSNNKLTNVVRERYTPYVTYLDHVRDVCHHDRILEALAPAVPLHWSVCPPAINHPLGNRPIVIFFPHHASGARKGRIPARLEVHSTTVSWSMTPGQWLPAKLVAGHCA